MSEIKRFDVDATTVHGQTVACMVNMESGRYVLHSDHEAANELLRAELAQAKRSPLAGLMDKRRDYEEALALGKTAMDLADHHEAEAKRLRTQLATTRERLEAIASALQSVLDAEDRECPICDGLDGHGHGHDPDCALADAIKEPK